jgi:hypothetical protein
MAMIRCTACSYQIPAEAFSGTGPVRCPLCQREVNAVVLPAASRAGVQPPTLIAEPPGPGEAACFYNPERKATETCSHCGVFMSSAWAAKWGRDTVCLKCLEELRTRRKDARFEVRRTLWDNVALACAALPLALFVPSTLFGPLIGIPLAFAFMSSAITAPTALGLALIHWNKPRSLVPRGRWRLVVALVLSVLQCALWVMLIAALFNDKFWFQSSVRFTPDSPP